MSQMLTFESFVYVENPNHTHGDKRLEAENQVAQEISTAISNILKSHGMLIVGGKTLARYATYEEQIAVKPRKIHMKNNQGLQICNTPHVSKKNMTRNEAEVTCKNCLNVLEEEDFHGPLPDDEDLMYVEE